MSDIILYLKAEQKIEAIQDDVFLKDVASLFCTDQQILAKAKAIKIHKFGPKDEKRLVFSVLKLIELIQTNCPHVTVENVGEAETIVERVKTDKEKSWVMVTKIVFVSLISFFGTAFTIMAFHNDIGISKVFGRVYELIAGQASDGYTILEFSYSIGLAVGIIVFYNHIGGRRITKDPTPTEVEMRVYEKDVNNALIETADREGKTIDVS